MKVFLIRHGIAVDRSQPVRDEFRYLTSKGRWKFFKAATELKKTLRPDLILSSPLVRAVQTAEILALATGFEGPLLISERLSPGFSTEDLFVLAEEHAGTDRLGLVGHNPDFDAVASELSGEEIHLKKGDVAALEIQEGQGRLLWRTEGGKRT